MAVKKNTLLIVAGSLLILLLIGVTILLISEKQTNKELVMEFNLDKEDLENQYTDFARQYDELKLTVSNDSLSVLLEQEQLKTQRLLEELRTVKSSNATEIRRLKKELASLRKVMIGYINQMPTASILRLILCSIADNIIQLSFSAKLHSTACCCTKTLVMFLSKRF